jgi:hypothetical protein
MNWIFSRFPDETVKIASACRLKFDKLMSGISDIMIYRQLLNRNSALTLSINFSAKRFEYTRFHPETGYIKYPNNPVDPVYLKD